MLGDATIVNSHDVQDCILWIVSKAIPVLCHAPDNSVHHDNAALGTHAPKFSATIRKLYRDIALPTPPRATYHREVKIVEDDPCVSLFRVEIDSPPAIAGVYRPRRRPRLPQRISSGWVRNPRDIVVPSGF